MRRVHLLAVAAVFVALSAPTAHATSDTYCVVVATEVGPAADAVPREVPPVCFGNFADAIADATGITVPDLVPGDPTGLAALLRQTLVQQSGTVIGIDYEHSRYASNFPGHVLVWTTNNTRGCLDNAHFQASSMPSGWDNVVSAADSYQGCGRFTHYEHPSFGGALVHCPCDYYIGDAMNDRTSSVRWCQGPDVVCS